MRRDADYETEKGRRRGTERERAEEGSDKTGRVEVITTS